MFTESIQPRFSETDALGHINNTVLPIWFEGCRDPIFKFFTSNLDPAQWRLILAKFSVEFLAELFYGEPVTINTGVSRIGNSSFEVTQQAVQQGRVCATGVVVLVHYDFAQKRSAPITPDIAEQLRLHLWSTAEGQSAEAAK